jgi:endonuclease-8
VAEGDSIARLAARLDSVTASCVITACDVRHPRFATADLVGQRILGWAPRGKHLLMRADAGITMHSHLRMSGRWTLLGAGKRLPRAVAARLRIALRLDDARTLAGIDLPVLTLVRTDDEHQVVGHLGPDLLGGSTATDEGLARAAVGVAAAGAQRNSRSLIQQPGGTTELDVLAEPAPNRSRCGCDREADRHGRQSSVVDDAKRACRRATDSRGPSGPLPGRRIPHGHL